MDEKSEDVILACIDLIEYCSLKGATGAEFDIVTPNGTIHFIYDFTIVLKNQDVND